MPPSSSGLVGLYEETDKPADPVDFIKQFLGTSAAANEQLKAENSALKRQVADLQARISELEGKVAGAQ